MHDLPRAITGKSIGHELFWARTATVALAIIAAAFALLSPIELVGQLGAFGWGVFASALVPVIGLGLNWKRATPLAAASAIIASLAINVAIVLTQLGEYAIPSGVSGGAIALLVSMLFFVGISRCSAPCKIAPDVEAVMEF